MIKCECGKEHDAVPRESYNRVAKARDNEKSRADGLQAEMAEASKTSKTELKAVQDELKAAKELAGQAEGLQAKVAELEGQNSGLQLRQDFMGQGILSDEGLGVAETLWNALGDNRPASVADWLKDGAPQAVTFYMGQQGGQGGAGGDGGQGGDGGGGERKPGFTRVGGKGDATGGTVTAEQISTMSQAEYDEYMDAKYG